jgi:hypothetical protein
MMDREPPCSRGDRAGKEELEENCSGGFSRISLLLAAGIALK